MVWRKLPTKRCWSSPNSIMNYPRLRYAHVVNPPPCPHSPELRIDVRVFPFSQKNYEQNRDEFLNWETILASAKCTIIDNEQLSFALLDQIQHLYLLLCKRNHQKPKFTRKQIKGQIDFIAEELDTIQEIIQLSNDMIAKETRSDIAQCASTKSDKRRSHWDTGNRKPEMNGVLFICICFSWTSNFN